MQLRVLLYDANICVLKRLRKATEHSTLSRWTAAITVGSWALAGAVGWSLTRCTAGDFSNRGRRQPKAFRDYRVTVEPDRAMV